MSQRLRAPPDWAIARVPGAGAGTLAAKPLSGGSVNEVFLVRSGEGAFVLRLNGAAWRRPGVDRHRELALHRAAAGAGVAPEIVHADPERDGLLITRFEPGRLWGEADYLSRPALHRLGERLQVLHALRPPEVAPFDAWAIAEDYLRLIRQRASAPEVPSGPLQRLEAACADIRAAGVAACIAHGDLTQSNLLQGRRLWLLDWEYAQCSDAFMDIACVLAYYPGAMRLGAELAAAAGLQPERTILAPRVYVYRALSWLWHLARGENAAAPEP